MAWTAPRTWLAGETVTAAVLNQQIRDNFNAFGAAWTTYTPTWTSTGTSPAIGNGTLTGRYAAMGLWVFAYLEFVAGSTTTFGTGNYKWALPMPARAWGTGTQHVGHGGWLHALDVSASRAYWFVPRVLSGGVTDLELAYDSSTVNGALGFQVGATNFAWAVGDSIRGYYMYEAASS